MMRLRSYILAHIHPFPSASPIFSVHRILSASAAAPAVSRSPGFAVEEYLVDTCGLTRPRALKAATKLSHLKSPSKPDAVVAFLVGLGFSTANVAAAVGKNPKLLCSSVEKTLAPIVVELTGLGLSRSEIAQLFLLASVNLRLRSIVSRLQYYLPLFGNFKNLLRALERDYYLLSTDLDKVIKPNVAFLGECGLGACDIAKLCISKPWMLSTKPERVRAMAVCAESIGVPRSSGMFKQALHAVAFLNEEKIAAKLENLKNTFRWSDAEVAIAACKAPKLLTFSKDMLQRKSKFLMSEVGLEPVYIAHRPIAICLSLERRLRPRYYVIKFLKEHGLLERDPGYYGTVLISDKVFMEKFICPHEVAAPHLAEDYAAACRGELPTRFISVRTKSLL